MAALVGIIMGSKSDLPALQPAADFLQSVGVSFEMKVVSAHRTPLGMVEYAQSAEQRGLKVIIAGAGGAAHLPGMVASLTVLPVIGVPVESKALSGVDSLYSIVQMPPGIPVATMAINGGKNAGILAARILAVSDPILGEKLRSHEKNLIQQVDEMNRTLLDKSST